MTVADLDFRMPAAELDRWAAYEAATGPLDGTRVDILMAQLTRAVMTGPVKKPPKVRDLIPKWHRRRRTARTAEQVEQQWARWARSRGSGGGGDGEPG